MTSGRRAKELRRANGHVYEHRLAAPSDDDVQGFQVGWAETDDGAPEIEATAVKMVKDFMGRNRTTEVTVERLYGVEANALLSELVSRTTEEKTVNLYRRYRALLREHPGSVLVFAQARGRRPRGR